MPAPRKRTKSLSKKESLAVNDALNEMEAEGVVAKKNKRLSQPARKRREALKKRLRAEARKNAPKCHGFNLLGKPCKTHPLKPGTVFDDVEVRGNYCLVHEPAIDQSHWRKRFIGRENEDGEDARIMRPMEILAEAVAKSPVLAMAKHFEALGLEWDPDTREIVRKIDSKTGKPARGATHVGFSRDGDARRSRHVDFALQTRIEEQLLDRLYGKARVSMEIGAGIGLGTVQIPADKDRAMEVASILHEVGALPDEKQGTGSKKAKK